MDINGSHLHILKNSYSHEENVLFLQADAQQLLFTSSSLDALLIQNCPSLFVQTMPEIIRVIKPGGYAISINHDEYLHFPLGDFYFSLDKQ